LLPAGTGNSALHLSSTVAARTSGDTIQVSNQDGALSIATVCPGDFDGDGRVSIGDVQQIAYRWNQSAGDPLYKPMYDLDDSGWIDMGDIQPVANRWNVGCAQAVAGPRPASFQNNLAATGMSLWPSGQTTTLGQTFTASVAVSNAINLGAFEFTLAYSPTIVDVISVTVGAFPGSTGRTVVASGPSISATAGNFTFGAFSIGATPSGPDGNGLLASLTLRANSSGVAGFTFQENMVTDIAGNPQPVGSSSGGSVAVMPVPVSTVVPPAGGILTFTANNTTTVSFPGGASTEPLTVTFSLTPTTGLTGTFQAIGNGFVIEARDSSGNLVTTFAKPFTITVQYLDADVVGMNELDLKLYYWNPETGQWVAIPTVVDAENNILTAVLSHLTRFAVLYQTQYRLFLPVVLRGYAGSW
ncbi:MAG: cohesin domain-containing protein, partial [Dehalococcoidia bacterium]|nr:cohesin domain-containing protein [Dehalococcoidia bacterium]